MEKKGNLKKYERNLTERELSEGTKELYLRQAVELLDFLKGKPATKKRMIAYKDYLIDRGLAVTTTNTYITAVNSYLRFAGYERSRLKTRRIQKRRSLDHILSLEEYKTLLDYALESGRKKYYYIMKTLAQTGIRVSELKYFTVEALAQKAIIVSNKGKVREIYLPDHLIDELNAYCDMEERKNGVIFRGNTQNAISRIEIYKMLAHMADMTGIARQKVHSHSFRHLFAITYMEHYSNLFELADILGHSSLEITRIYTTTTAEEKRKRMDRLGL